MIENQIIVAVKNALADIYEAVIEESTVQLQKTRKEFEGDFTIVVFPFLRMSRKSPEETAKDIGSYLVEKLEHVSAFNIVKGFLNLEVSDAYWLDFLISNRNRNRFGFYKTETQSPLVLEYSSPNTNKPLHLGHVRNNLLGYSTARVLQAAGRDVKMVNLVNDRGIHICKTMVAWKKWGEGSNPINLNKKGDKYVGELYVKFESEHKKQQEELIAQGMSKDDALKSTPLIKEAQTLLKLWEAKDPGTVHLWEEMNDWVYKGFDITYDRMGVRFDKVYYESDTYLLGKQVVEEGLTKGILFKKEDGSIWADLSEEGLDEKLLMRGDGTSVYMTQDLGTAILRHDDFNADSLVYVVGNEQNYHFGVLKILLKKLGYDWSDKIFHLSYGMVELPEGKMKSREGTVVDADDLMEEMYQTAKSMTLELGKADELEKEQADKLFEMIGMGALKYFILKVDPKKNILFNPKESIDFTGNTGPFIQYTHARIKSVIRRAGDIAEDLKAVQLPAKEKQVLKQLYSYPATVKQAGDALSPALIANYAYDLVKAYNQFYQDSSILKAESQELKTLRLYLSIFTANVIRSSMQLLGIDVPEKM